MGASAGVDRKNDMGVISIDGLTRDYGNGKGVFDLSFDVAKGEAFGFLGPNGAGKTTTIRHLMGLIKSQKGSCTINGMDCWSESYKIQRTLSYIPGETAFFDDMTGTDYLNFIGKYRGDYSEKRKNELVDAFGLDARSKISKMSKGTKQKIAIVAAFMHDSDVFVLDEATSGLDPLMQNQFISLVTAERDKGKTILMSSHSFEQVERTCHRVGIIREGKLVAVDSIDALRANQVRSYVVTLQNVGDVQAFSKEPLTVTCTQENRVTVSVQNNMREFISVMNKYAVTNIYAPNQSLEEVFMHYYGGEQDV
ncbi:MAG: ABC transporter ATP-binding protein [Bifidobacteriaceae bacterium]|jgi:ABC-2 type transport system ATP-binding protein|nr:ABC transporter ATP-binding protein [Bifidobacteriaceae bacterium]